MTLDSVRHEQPTASLREQVAERLRAASRHVVRWVLGAASLSAVGAAILADGLGLMEALGGQLLTLVAGSLWAGIGALLGLAVALAGGLSKTFDGVVQVIDAAAARAFGAVSRRRTAQRMSIHVAALPDLLDDWSAKLLEASSAARGLLVRIAGFIVGALIKRTRRQLEHSLLAEAAKRGSDEIAYADVEAALRGTLVRAVAGRLQGHLHLLNWLLRALLFTVVIGPYALVLLTRR